MTEEDSGDLGSEPPRQSYRESRVRPEDLRSKNDTTATLACIGAAVVGALAWGALAYFARLEHGILAWAIGGLVGFTCVTVGGRGQKMAITAAIFALVAIVGGKVLAIQWSYEAALDTPEVRAIYKEFRADAEGWVALGPNPTDDQVETFMIEHDYGEEFDNAAEFRRELGPALAKRAGEVTTFESWTASLGRPDLIDALKEDFHILDLLFAFLGVSTAFGLVSSASVQAAKDAQQTRRAE